MKLSKADNPIAFDLGSANSYIAHLESLGKDAEESRSYAKKMSEGQVFLHTSIYRDGFIIGNVWLSKCFSCDGVAIWVRERLCYPTSTYEVLPNDDLPTEIKLDFLEAANILDASPRGTAAILRLCVQKLCIHLGLPGKNLNDDISSLVKAGLDQRIQKALDIIRVIGNNAVHPGLIDIRDDKETALALFRLINVIAEKTISEPKHVDDLYETLSPSVKAQIERRDKWIAGSSRQAADVSLRLRLVTSEPITPEDEEMLRFFNVHLVAN